MILGIIVTDSSGPPLNYIYQREFFSTQHMEADGTQLKIGNEHIRPLVFSASVVDISYCSLEGTIWVGDDEHNY